MFRDEAARRPDAVALVAGEVRVTYRELDMASDRWAAELAALGAGPGHVVPVALPRSVRLVTVLLGVLKAGAAATVLDPAWPTERLTGLMGQLGAEFVVADGEIAGLPVVREGTGSGPVPLDRVSPDDPCLLFFTSGSTGTPKGALVPHAGLAGLFAPPRFAAFGPGAVMPLAAALPWDMAAMELWGMLATGGTSVLIESSPLTSRQLRALVADSGCTLMWLTTSLFNAFVDEDPVCFAGLRQLVVGGERLSPSHVARFLRRHPSIELINGYGPVEVTCLSATHRVTLADTERRYGIPIGTPVPYTELFVVDGERECADGEVGELWAAGPRVALRYVGDHPANTTAFREWRGRRFYRTGDLVVREDGLLHFIGRADRQLKINGHRVEPAEVERAASVVPGVRTAVAVPLGEDRPHGLALFVSGAAAQPVADQLARTLPAYLRPMVIRQVTDFPVTANGKLDQARLLGELSPQDVVAEEHDEWQELVAAELASVLSRSLIPAGIPAGSALAGLGAGSLELVRLAMRLERRTGRLIDMAGLLRATDLASVADLVRTAPVAPAAHDTAAAITLDPSQTAFLLHSLERPSDTSPLCLMLWRLDGTVNVTALRAALEDVALRHEALRARYEFTDPPTAVAGPPNVEFTEVTDVATTLVLPLDPSTGAVWRAAVSATEFGLAVHHVAFDGWSEGLLAHDISHAYTARSAGAEPVFAEPAPSLRQLAAERLRQGRYRHDRADLARWRDLLTGATDLDLGDQPPAQPCRVGGHAVVRSVPALVLAHWSALATTVDATLFDALLAATCRALARQTAAPDIVIGTPVTMRGSHVEEYAIGCLINTVCVRPRLTADSGRLAAIRATHAAVTEAIALRDVGFLDLVRELDPPRTGRNPFYQVLFTVAEDAAAALDLPGCRTTFVRPDLVRPPTELHVEIRPHPDSPAEVSVAYQCDRVPASAAMDIADAIAAELSELAEQSSRVELSVGAQREHVDAPGHVRHQVQRQAAGEDGAQVR